MRPGPAAVAAPGFWDRLLVPDICCEMMHAQLDLRCPDHADPADCPDSLVSRWPHGQYGLRVHDGGSSVVGIGFCPWCGATLEGR